MKVIIVPSFKNFTCACKPPGDLAADSVGGAGNKTRGSGVLSWVRTLVPGL